MLFRAQVFSRCGSQPGAGLSPGGQVTMSIDILVVAAEDAGDA